MVIKVRGFCGIQKKDAGLEKLTAVIGRNGSGKTTLLNALRIATGADLNPLNLPASSKIYYNSTGMGNTTACIEFERFVFSSTWTSAGGSRMEGEFFQHERQTVGSDGTDFSSPAKPEDNYKRWMKAIPKTGKLDELQELLERSGCSEDEARDIRTQVQKEGWNAALDDVTARGRHWKKKWQDDVSAHEHQSMTYGDRRAQFYTPEGWTERLRGKTVEDQRKEVGELTAELADIETGGKAAADLDRDIAVAKSKVQSSERVIAKDKEALEKIFAGRDRINDKIRDLKAKAKDRTDKPDGDLHYAAYKVLLNILQWARANNEEAVVQYIEQEFRFQEWSAYFEGYHKFKEIDEELDRLEANSKQMDRDYARGKSGLNENEKMLEQEVKALENLMSLIPSDEQKEEAKKQAEAALKEAELQLKAIETMEKANKAYNEVQRNKAVIALLKPQGFRAKVQKEAIEMINMKMGKWTDGWGTVWLEEGFHMTMNGLPLAVCSSSEKWRANAIAQFALAELNNSPLVILDNAERLDSENLNKIVEATSLIETDTMVVFASAHDFLETSNMHVIDMSSAD